MTRGVALIAGASGHVGSQLAQELSDSDEWKTVALSRRPSAATSAIQSVSVDLLKDDVAAALRKAAVPTHIFYCGRAPHNESGKEDVDSNLAMLRRLVEAAEIVNPALSHVHIVEGGKWYGAHLGPYKTPAREDDRRHDGPNFYHSQEDWLRERQPGKSWTWSASRPSFVCAVTPGRGRNLVSLLGAYAALCRAQGHALDFPASAESFASLTEVTEARLLARAMIFMAITPAATNQAFNVTNGDALRWRNLWPLLADYYRLPVGVARPFSLSDWARDKEPLWRKVVQENGLQTKPLEEVASWPFGDFLFGQDHDVFSDTGKLRRAGFHETADTTRMIFDMLNTYRALRILP
jgi:nucleoside-diphosphate-sugar epimerase